MYCGNHAPLPAHEVRCPNQVIDLVPALLSFGQIIRADNNYEALGLLSSITEPVPHPNPEIESVPSQIELCHPRLVILNADDWGRDQENTNRTLDCIRRRTVSSVSAMVFMEDSERAAALARQDTIDAGLHLNFTTPFSARNVDTHLSEHQRKLTAYLRFHPLMRIVFNPLLNHSFQYVIAAQLDEFRRLYGAEAARLDGHHHMHLCANVLHSNLLPSGTIVRRNFSFQPGEKSLLNRRYRRAIDRRLSRRHKLVDFLFPLAPLKPRRRIQEIFFLARRSVVEVETHPINAEEYEFLTRGEISHHVESQFIASSFALPESGYCR